MGEILFATTNPHKIERFKAYCAPLGLSVISYADLKIDLDIKEDGKTPEENALKKAQVGFAAINGKLPVFGIDYWLNIEKFQEDLQPGPHVRRVKKAEGGLQEAVSDEELLSYFKNELDKVGGESRGFWTSAIALVLKPDLFYTQRFTRETLFTSIPSPDPITPGEPLNSLQVVPKTGKYFNQLTPGERLELDLKREKGYVDFMRSHIKEFATT